MNSDRIPNSSSKRNGTERHGGDGARGRVDRIYADSIRTFINDIKPLVHLIDGHAFADNIVDAADGGVHRKAGEGGKLARSLVDPETVDPIAGGIVIQ